jgi:phenylalanine-4-hydroxylase
MSAKNIAVLGIDHPGASDPLYRARRDEIAQRCREHRMAGLEPPRLTYTGEEHGTWRTVAEQLADLHAMHACQRYQHARQVLDIPRTTIPQLADLSAALRAQSGFTVRAIEGLIEPAEFLGSLAERVMSSTQYIRHASRPEYTPEPDIVHEVLGHMPMFVDPHFAALSVTIGRAARTANPAQLVFLDRLYWFTLEFGLVEEQGGVKAYGAGLLSSFGELPHAFTPDVQVAPFDADTVASTAYQFSAMQDRLFVVPSFEALHDRLAEFIRGTRYSSAGTIAP